MTPHDEVPWGEACMTVWRTDREVGHGQDCTVYDLAYDDTVPNPDGAVCNALSDDGAVCRLPRAHWDAAAMPHMKWEADLVMRSGVYVLACHLPDGRTVTALESLS